MHHERFRYGALPIMKRGKKRGGRPLQTNRREEQLGQLQNGVERPPSGNGNGSGSRCRSHPFARLTVRGSSSSFIGSPSRPPLHSAGRRGQTPVPATAEANSRPAPSGNGCPGNGCRFTSVASEAEGLLGRLAMAEHGPYLPHEPGYGLYQPGYGLFDDQTPDPDHRMLACQNAKAYLLQSSLTSGLNL